MNKLKEYLTTKFTAKQNNNIANGLMFAGVLVNLLDIMNNAFEIKLGPAILAIALVAIGAVYQWLFVQCPHCGDPLKKLKNKLPERCTNCGKRLDTLPKKQ